MARALRPFVAIKTGFILSQKRESKKKLYNCEMASFLFCTSRSSRVNSRQLFHVPKVFPTGCRLFIQNVVHQVSHHINFFLNDLLRKFKCRNFTTVIKMWAFRSSFLTSIYAAPRLRFSNQMRSKIESVSLSFIRVNARVLITWLESWLMTVSSRLADNIRFHLRIENMEITATSFTRCVWY